ncbi:MAG: hypothetical protein ACXIUB_03630 [Wenzhouxiangella sp.]
MERLTDVLVPSLVVLLIFGLVVSVVQRLRAEKPLFAEPPLRALFFETWVSGHSNIRAVNLIAYCRNCLHVSVTPSDLHVGLHFPWTLMFFPALTGFDLTIPKSDIVSVDCQQGRFRGAVVVQFKNPQGQVRSFRLYLSRSQEFLAAMRSG